MVASSYTTGMDSLQLRRSSYMLMFVISNNFISRERNKKWVMCICVCICVCIENRVLFHKIHSNHNFTISPSSTPPNSLLPPLSPRFIPLQVLLQKRTGFQKMTEKQGKRSYNKKSQKPSYQDWERQSSRKKRVLGAVKRVRNRLNPTVRSTTKTPS